MWQGVFSDLTHVVIRIESRCSSKGAVQVVTTAVTAGATGELQAVYVGRGGCGRVQEKLATAWSFTDAGA